MEILKESKTLFDYTVSIRRKLHENPELSGFEFETIKLICSELDKLGIPYVNIRDGGVLATIDGPKPGKTVLLRADCDALPLNELPNNAKKPKVCVSKVPGAAHMCGHDAHTAMLLSAAHILWAHKDEIPGRIYLLFERGEEGGGNIYYIFKYFEENNIHIDAAYGEHVGMGFPAGFIGCQGGPSHAGNFSYRITITGKGGHGSRPDNSRNPIDCFVAIYECIKSIRMNYIAPDVVLTNSMGMVQAGAAGNVIPHTLTFAGTCRFYDAAAGNIFREKLIEICDAQAALFGCTVTYDALRGPGLPVIANNRVAEIGAAAIKEALGDVIRHQGLNMGSESFSYLSNYFPSVMLRIGVRNEEEGMTIGGHNPGFDIDENGMLYGTAAFVAAGLGFLNANEYVPHTGDPMLSAMTVDQLREFTHSSTPPRRDPV